MNPDYACASFTAVVEATSNESVTTVLCFEFYVRYGTVRYSAGWCGTGWYGEMKRENGEKR